MPLCQCLEADVDGFCPARREWNANAKNCHAAQAMLQAVLHTRRPEVGVWCRLTCVRSLLHILRHADWPGTPVMLIGMVLASWQEILAVPGLYGLLESLQPYTHRHFARCDRLLRSTFLGDYILAAMNVLEEERIDAQQQAADAQQQAPQDLADPLQRRQPPMRALLRTLPAATAGLRGAVHAGEVHGG